MTTKISCHWQITHQGQQDDQYLSAWHPLHIKIIFSSDDDIPGLATALKWLRPGGRVIVRHHPVSENWEHRGIVNAAAARIEGQAHAAVLGRLWNSVRTKYNVAPEQMLWTGLNEPHVWADEPPNCTATYYAEFTTRMHAQGLAVMVLNFGVGWPGNDNIKDAPPLWGPYEPVRQVMKAGDVLGLHEYWPVRGPSFAYRWLAGRFEQCPWQVPIVIGECGLDNAVAPGATTLATAALPDPDEYIMHMALNPKRLFVPEDMVSSAALDHYGYHGLGNGNLDVASAEYLAMLRWYDEKLAKDWRVQSAMPFTYDFSHPWETFDIRREPFMKVFLPYVASVGGTAMPILIPAPIPPPVVVPPPPSTPIWGSAALTPWRELCEKYAAQHDFSPEVVGTTIMTESSGDPAAISTAGAVGLMQVMPREAGAAFANRPTRAQLLDPETNVDWGCRILAGYTIENGGSLLRGLAAYFGGSAAGHDLGSPNAVKYLPQWVKTWLTLWKQDLLFGAGPGPDITAVRWNAEEAVRELEATRARLRDNVIAPLYR